MKTIASLGLAGLALATSFAASAAPPKPALRLVDREPLVVRGEGFRAGERVRVTALTGVGPRFAWVMARGGRFRVAFRIPSRGCSAARSVVARGSAGDRASLTFGGMAGVCIPPPRD